MKRINTDFTFVTAECKKECKDHNECIMLSCKTMQEKMGKLESGRKEENLALRQMLWEMHYRGPGVHKPYGDDGNMQCCMHDFKRESIESLRDFLFTKANAMNRYMALEIMKINARRV